MQGGAGLVFCGCLCGPCSTLHPRLCFFGMTDRDLKKIEERLNALSRVVRGIADKLELNNDTSLSFYLTKIRSDLNLSNRK